MSTETKKTTIELIIQFANQKPGLDFNDYGDRKYYDKERLEIRRDLHDFKYLLEFALNRIENLDGKLTEYLTKSSGRLTLKNGKLEYCTGQYFPTEYRPAVNQVLKSLIWEDLREEKDSAGNHLYNTGDALRAYFKRNLSRKCFKNYIGN